MNHAFSSVRSSRKLERIHRAQTSAKAFFKSPVSCQNYFSWPGIHRNVTFSEDILNHTDEIRFVDFHYGGFDAGLWLWPLTINSAQMLKMYANIMKIGHVLSGKSHRIQRMNEQTNKPTNQQTNSRDHNISCVLVDWSKEWSIPAVVVINVSGHIDLRTTQEEQDDVTDDKCTESNDDEFDGTHWTQFQPRHDDTACHAAHTRRQRRRRYVT